MAEVDTLLRDAMGGDRRAWEALVRAQGPRLFGIARAVTRDPALAEDVVQETFLRVVERRLAKGLALEPQEQQPTWSRKVATERLLGWTAVRISIDAVRRREARRQREEAHAVMLSKNAGQSRPESPALAAELKQQLDEGLALLDAETRAALWLHIVEGEGIRAVAASLAVPPSTVSDRIAAGVRRLREFLQGRGFALPAGGALAALLREVSAAEVPATLLERLDGLGAMLPPAGTEAAGTLGTRLGGVGTGSKSALVPLAVAITLIGIAGFLTWYALHPEKPTEVVEATGAQPHAEATFGGNGPSEAPALETALPAVPPAAGSPPAADATLSREKPAEQEAAGPTFRLWGIVYDVETSLPIAGAVVRPRDEKGLSRIPGVKAEAVAGDDGEYELVLPTAVEQYFQVSADGYITQNVFLRHARVDEPSPGTAREVSSGPKSDQVSFALTPRLEAMGRIVDERGEPLEGAQIRVLGTRVGKRTTYLSGGGEEVVTSAGDGAFRIALELFGLPRLCVLAPGHGGTVYLGASPGATGLIVEVPRGASVSGKALDERGTALRGDKVRWLTETPDQTRWEGQVHTGDDGIFEIAGLPAPGVHWVLLEPMGSPRWSVRQLRQEFGESPPGFARRLEVMPGRDVADVTLERAALAEWERRREEARAARAAAASAAPAAAPEGPASGPSTAAAVAPRMPRAAHASGVVRDPAGQGVPLARIGLTITNEAGTIHLSHCVSDPKGQFHCGEGTDLGTGPHRASLLVTHRDWAPVRLELGAFTVPGEGNAIAGQGPIELGPLTVTLSAGYTLRLKVTDSRGAPIEGVQVLRRKGEDREDDSARDEGAGLRDLKLFGRTTKEGTCVLSHQSPADSFRWILYHPDYVPLEIPATEIAAVDGLELDMGTFVLRGGGSIKGVVRRADGSPFAYGLVTLLGRALQPPARTDGEGRFVLEHVAPGIRTPLVLPSDDPAGGTRGIPVESPCEAEVMEGGESFVDVWLRE